MSVLYQNIGIVNEGKPTKKKEKVRHSKTQANNGMYLNPKNIIPYTI